MGVVRFSVAASPELLDALSDCLLSAGAGALEEGPSSLTAYADSPELLRELARAVVEFRLRVREAGLNLTVEEPQLNELADDFDQAWLDHLEPEQVTDTFVARPTHHADAPSTERTIWLEPSPAFGEGGHPSTRLAARVVEREARRRSGGSLLDVGTGTGLLALVGLSSGLHRALGIDVDPRSLEAASKNAALNAVSERFEVSAMPLDTVSQRFDVVVANMLVPTLRELAPALVARLAPAGLLVLSGLLTEDADELSQLLSTFGLREVGRDASGDWCSLEFSHDEI